MHLGLSGLKINSPCLPCLQGPPVGISPTSVHYVPAYPHPFTRPTTLGPCIDCFFCSFLYRFFVSLYHLIIPSLAVSQHLRCPGREASPLTGSSPRAGFSSVCLKLRLHLGRPMLRAYWDFADFFFFFFFLFSLHFKPMKPNAH